MNKQLTESQLDELKQDLDKRYNALRWEIAELLTKSGDERYAAIAGQVHDTGDESVADLLVDINYSAIDHLLHEITEVEQARMKIPRGSYGACIDCGDAIPFSRLQAEPYASRCMACQEKYEHGHAGKGEPSL